MHSDTTIQVNLAFANGAGSPGYITAPFDCTVLDVQCTAQGDPGDAETVTVSEGGTTVGVATFGTDIAAGAKATYVADTTNGDRVVDKGDVITLTPSNGDAAANCHCNLILDPYKRGQL